VPSSKSGIYSSYLQYQVRESEFHFSCLEKEIYFRLALKIALAEMYVQQFLLKTLKTIAYLLEGYWFMKKYAEKNSVEAKAI